MAFNSYRRMTVAELRDILERAIEVLDDYPDDTKIIERANTYGCSTPYLSTPKGFYPLNDLEFENDDEMDESINEKRGFVRKYRGCSIHDMGDVYVITNKNGLNIGEEKTELGCEGLIDDYLDNQEDEISEKYGYIVEDDAGDILTRVSNKIYEIVHKYLVKDCGHDCYFLERTLTHKINDIIFNKNNYAKWDWIFNKIDETVMKYFDDEDLGTYCVREIIEVIQEEDI